MIRRPPVSTQTYTLVPYTTLFRVLDSQRGKHGSCQGRIAALAWHLAAPGPRASQRNASERRSRCPTNGQCGVADPWRRSPGPAVPWMGQGVTRIRSEEHKSELQSLMRISYVVFCLKKKTATH